jgi:hypothetical protein
MAYFSNGTEGTVLDNQCAVCPVGRQPDLPCPVFLVQLQYNYEQLGKGQDKLRGAITCLVDERGTCLMKKAIEKAFGIPDPDDPINVLPSMVEWAKERGVAVL